MNWQTIGNSETGISHIAAGKGCEDSIQFKVIVQNNREILVCCASDGAGSAAYAAIASELATTRMMEKLSEFAFSGFELKKKNVIKFVEDIYDELSVIASLQEVEITEYSCTLLGCYLTEYDSVFFQIGDGAIIVNNDTGYYSAVFIPQNGEYQNTTSFIVDDKDMANLQVLNFDKKIDEVAIFTDGLQLLALNIENNEVHQPFFSGMFQLLRSANDEKKINILNQKLSAYLQSDIINDRTDDDKTLFLATRIH